jgi:hypothetical protein
MYQKTGIQYRLGQVIVASVEAVVTDIPGEVYFPSFLDADQLFRRFN